MTKSKQPEFKVGEVLKKGIQLFTIEKVVDEPTLTINDYASGTTLVITRTEARRDYDLFSRKAKTGHPFRQKTVKLETIPPESTANRPTITNELTLTPGYHNVDIGRKPFVGGIPQGMGNPDKQASTPSVGAQQPTSEKLDNEQKQAQNGAHPFDPATFDLKGGPPCVMSVSGKTWTGGRLRKTLTNLLAFYGITGSPAKLKDKLVLNYPDSQGLREMLSILEGGTK